jgi:hypothetical protein
MMAAIWTLIAMLGASQLAVFGLILHVNSSLGNRIDALGTRLDAMGASLGSRIDNLAEAFVRHTHSI